MRSKSVADAGVLGQSALTTPRIFTRAGPSHYWRCSKTSPPDRRNPRGKPTSTGSAPRGVARSGRGGPQTIESAVDGNEPRLFSTLGGPLSPVAIVHRSM